MLTIRCFEDLFDSDIKNTEMIIFDIDGTISKFDIIYDIIKETLSHFNISADKTPLLGKEIFNINWLKQNLKIDSVFAVEIINYYEDLFYKTSQECFIRNVYNDVAPFFEKLRDKNISIGIFTLRKISLAVIQIQKMGLINYIRTSKFIKYNNGLHITGTGLNSQCQLSPLEEKFNQLNFHFSNSQILEREKIMVIGDSLETDIYAAKQMKFNYILIQR